MAGSAGGGCCRGWRGSAQRSAPGCQHRRAGQLRSAPRCLLRPAPLRAARSRPAAPRGRRRGRSCPTTSTALLSGNSAPLPSRLNCIVSLRNWPSGVIIPIFPPLPLSLLCRNDSLGTWSTQGCKTVLTDASHTKCLCDRLSTFAILAQQPREIVSNKGGEKIQF